MHARIYIYIYIYIYIISVALGLVLLAEFSPRQKLRYPALHSHQACPSSHHHFFEAPTQLSDHNNLALLKPVFIKLLKVAFLS